MRHSSIRNVLALAVLVGMGAACATEQTSPTALSNGRAPASSLLPWWDTSSGTLIECPAPPAPATATALIGAAGGVLSAGGVTVVIPQNAVLGDALSFTLTVPTSQYVEFQVSPVGLDHYTFAAPVVVTIDYGRCGSAYDGSQLSAWNIDPVTKALLERMTGVDNKLTHTVTFVTGHFSGYAVAD